MEAWHVYAMRGKRGLTLVSRRNLYMKTELTPNDAHGDGGAASETVSPRNPLVTNPK